jgi:ferredoxin--NADP+ reductase
MPLTVAIIGSGPAGCYAAEQLARLAPAAEIDVIDRLPTPYGLVRAGVAPDHQGTKSSDRRLGIPGEELPGVHGSGAFTRWINGHPDDADRAVDLDRVRSAVVIGHGNVAIDVARVLAKSREEMARSDLAPFIEAAIARAPLAEIHLVGRRGAAEASFTAVEIDEMGRLARAHPVVASSDLPPAAGAGNAAVLEILHRFAALPDAGKPLRLPFHFHLKPLRFEGATRLERVVLERQRLDGGAYVSTGKTVAIPADLAVTCIGYQCRDCGGLVLESGIFRNDAGRVAPGLYVVGWAKRGPTGTIPTNRGESHAVAERLVAEVTPDGRAGRAGLLTLLRERGAEPVNLAGWQKLSAAEKARAAPGRAREKLRSLSELLAAARG